MMLFASPVIAWGATVAAIHGLPAGARRALAFLALIQTLGTTSLLARAGPLLLGHDYITDQPLWSAVMQIGAALLLAQPALTPRRNMRRT
ncbi:hypothetical protein [Rathayibacter tanaceti]|uniref:Uncharacterized protein n=1 Tax=Rathayibacter tanaceti TaxID=1671680 RepID=A0AAE6V580_9MICO|nr:hypothetical protein [Rathayibacter tanaceti]QHC54500.1 hypothetical protein GSU10_01710 [Rathayibacter tanaceti]